MSAEIESAKAAYRAKQIGGLEAATTEHERLFYQLNLALGPGWIDWIGAHGGKASDPAAVIEAIIGHSATRVAEAIRNLSEREEWDYNVTEATKQFERYLSHFVTTGGISVGTNG